MTFERVLVQAAVTDLREAESWYALLFGTGPSARPMDGLIEWHLGDTFGVQVFHDPDHAGHSAMVLDESDLDQLAARLIAVGIADDGPEQVTASRILVLRDPDGNRVVVSGV
ncbi:catechol-2,3-dioxygenase [Friedmanniella endophytica]|uniref:Catechol-2,3-dioxygenase n=1 Tax=Microlunatus kandeliicorticis TaxID=1759536 RepID=A0A7W3INV1_9ACTN|nr:VOC family protein [Microlunatus kandeliicorticis]MBA8792482.1 catechol-2,3-dioxygenase [Microlunatus kandeliicorticis]